MFEEIREIMSEALGVKESQLQLDANLRDDLGIDSLDAVELMMTLEDHLGIKIDETKAQDLATIKDIVELVESLKG